MAEPALHPIKHALYTGISTIIVAAISAFGAVRVAQVNRQAEYQKAALGYSKIADHVTQLDTRVDATNQKVDRIAGAQEEMNKLLQGFLQSNTGATHIDIPPPPVKTYGELPGADRPYRRYPIGRRITIPAPKDAAKTALSGLQKLETKTVVSKPLPKLQPLPSKLDNISN